MSTTELTNEQEQLVDCLDQRVFELIERVDRQAELVMKMAPLLEEANQLVVKIQDDTEELMLILDTI